MNLSRKADGTFRADSTKHVLRPLCRRAHESEPGSGTTWRYRGNGRTGPCVQCQALSRKKWESSRRGKEKLATYRKEYRETPEGRAATERAFRQYLATEKGREAWRRCQRKYVNKRRAEDERFALQQRLRSRLHHAFYAYSSTGKQKHADEYGIDYQAILEHVGPCPGPRSEWHLDHIRPLSSFDWNDPSTPAAAFAPENHQWLREKDNLSKGSAWAPTEL
jgi:hypothetical protein